MRLSTGMSTRRRIQCNEPFAEPPNRAVRSSALRRAPKRPTTREFTDTRRKTTSIKGETKHSMGKRGKFVIGILGINTFLRGGTMNKRDTFGRSGSWRHQEEGPYTGCSERCQEQENRHTEYRRGHAMRTIITTPTARESHLTRAIRKDILDTILKSCP